MTTAIVSYVPAPHRGYIKLFRAYAGSVLYVLGSDYINAFAPLRRHLPGNTPEDAACMVRALGIFAEVRILTPANMGELAGFDHVIMPDEDVSRVLAARCPELPIAFDDRWLLRWHKDAALAGRRPEGEDVVTAEEGARQLMGEAFSLAARAPDWWRQIGALLVRDGNIVLRAHNRHFPTEHTAYILGDPRSNFEAGEHIDMTVAGHAEASIIATAARKGIRTEGCDLFVTTFPCVPCATLCSLSGLRRLYYTEGYSQIHGADTLRASGVEIIRVLLPPLS